MLDDMLQLFISYSRSDTPFADRLQADLKARNFDAWVDRRKLEGGQVWLEELQRAIERSKVLLLVLSPDALNSQYVKMEYRHALRLGIPIIPLHYHYCESVPMELNDIQWINFQEEYTQGLSNLLLALTAYSIPKIVEGDQFQLTHQPANISTIEEDKIVKASPAIQQPVDFNALYREGLKAQARGDLDSASILWQQILTHDSDFGSGSLANQLDQLNDRLLPIRIERLYQQIDVAAQANQPNQYIAAIEALLQLDPEDQEAITLSLEFYRADAEVARKAGDWADEIDALQKILYFSPEDDNATEHLPIAQQNQRASWHYQNIKQFVGEGDLESAKSEFLILQEEAPYYGDPDGVLKSSHIANPLTYDEEINAVIEMRKKEARRQGIVILVVVISLSVIVFSLIPEVYTPVFIRVTLFVVSIVALIACIILNIISSRRTDDNVQNYA